MPLMNCMLLAIHKTCGRCDRATTPRAAGRASVKAATALGAARQEGRRIVDAIGLANIAAGFDGLSDRCKRTPLAGPAALAKAPRSSYLLLAACCLM
jgi:hypothetical protein